MKGATVLYLCFVIATPFHVQPRWTSPCPTNLLLFMLLIARLLLRYQSGSTPAQPRGGHGHVCWAHHPRGGQYHHAFRYVDVWVSEWVSVCVCACVSSVHEFTCMQACVCFCLCAIVCMHVWASLGVYETMCECTFGQPYHTCNGEACVWMLILMSGKFTPLDGYGCVCVRRAGFNFVQCRTCLTQTGNR